MKELLLAELITQVKKVLKEGGERERKGERVKRKIFWVSPRKAIQEGKLALTDGRFPVLSINKTEIQSETSGLLKLKAAQITPFVQLLMPLDAVWKFVAAVAATSAASMTSEVKTDARFELSSPNYPQV